VTDQKNARICNIDAVKYRLVRPTVSPRRSVHSDETAGWHLAVRTAVALSLVMVAVAYALRHFLDLSGAVIVALAFAAALPVGLALPAARLPIPKWLDDPDLWETDEECGDQIQA
jgi:hypothetical protein